MRYFKKHFKVLFLSALLIPLLSACGGDKVIEQDVIMHESTSGGVPSAAPMSREEEKRKKKRELERKSSDNDDMERTD